MNNSEVKDIISLIKDLDINTSFNVEIPSLQKSLKFKQLTTEQLKRLLKTIIDSPVYSTEFILTFNSIIKENCLDPEFDINNLTVYDKLIILYKTRIESISQSYTFYFTDEEINQYNLKEKSKTISLADHFDNFLKECINFNSVTYTHNDCIITCNLPTLGTENKLEKELHKNTKIDINTPEELRVVIGDTFINEITKFISSITINETVIDFLVLDFKNRIKIVESLPTSAINNAIKYIESYRNIIKKLITYNIVTETTQSTEVSFTKDFPTDATFFNM
jgi:hypothetical protein